MVVNKIPSAKLSILCSKIGSGATPRGGSSVYLDSGEVSLIRSQNILNNEFSKSGLVFISTEAAAKLNNVEVESNDVLLNITGDSVARCCQVNADFLPARVNQHVAIIRPKMEILDVQYLRYYLVSPSMQVYMLSLAGAGATRNALTKAMIENFDIPLPDVTIQRAIAHTLGTLDDKIELNRKMNTTLESMAQALFKSWFVDFDPVIDNALAAGNPIPEPLQARAEVRQALGDKRKPLPEAIRQQFPDQFVFTKEMGWVPEGWSIACIKDIGSVVTGKTPPKSVEAAFSVSGVPFLTPSDIDVSVFAVSTDRSLTAEGVASVRKSLIPAWSICVTCIGSQMGKTVINPFEATTNQQINSIKVNDEPVLYWLFLLLRGMRDELLLLGSSGSTMPIVNKSTFESVQLLRPSHPVLHYFSRQVAPILQKVLHSTENMKSLGEIRDTLLPKLLSGELRIPDAEKLVAEAV
jgi:type I restriction enzyme S subunit